MDRTRPPHQRQQQQENSQQQQQQQQRQGWFDIHGRPALPPQAPLPSPRAPLPPQPPLPLPRHSTTLNVHGRPPPPQPPQAPQPPLLSPRPHSNNNVNVHHHHHHHHHLQTPPPSPSPWHGPLTSPYYHHNQYYPYPYGHSPPQPFPVPYYPNYSYESYYGGGSSHYPNYNNENFYGGGGSAETTTATAVQGASRQSDDHHSTTSGEAALTEKLDGLVLTDQQLGRHPYTMPNWRPKSKEELRDFIRYQIEFYFSDTNLENDWYLWKNMDEEGWVDVALIASFPRIESQCREIDLILESLKPSLDVEVQGNKMRRKDDWWRWVPKSVSTCKITTNRR